MAHLHELRDTDTHFVIDPVTRTISNANDAKNKLMQYDHNSEIMTFEIPQYVDGHDMSQCDKVEVHYINIDSKTKDQSKDVFPCKAAAKTDNDIVFALEDGKLIFCWKVSGNATVYSGNLNFLVRFACIDDEGKICYKWHTDIFKGITISDGINNTEAVAETYSDVLEQWKKELEDAAGSGSGTASLADWVKQPEKPTYTASEVGALPDTTKIPSKTSDLQNDSGFLTEHQDLSGYALKSEVPKSASDVGADAAGTAESKVSVHNTATDSHNDIRELISGLTQRLNALADSDDTTLDQMSEVVAYIKSNKSLIDAITTSKVSVTDIIDNLTTNVANKPLSAAQGVALKALIDAITTVELDETLTDNTKAAPADVVGKLKGDLSQQKSRIDATSEIVTNSGSEFYGLNPSSNVSFTASTDAVVYSYKKNQFVSPSKLGLRRNTATVHDIVFGEETITASLDSGEKFAYVGTKPIFLKAGTYTFSASIEILSGSGSGNIGFIYIHTCDKDGNEIKDKWNSIQLKAESTFAKSTKALDEDTFVMFNFYVNMNGTITENLTLKWFDISINKESSYSGYEKYAGEVVYGTSGTLTAFYNMNAIADKDVNIAYKVVVKNDSYENVKAQVEINRLDIEELKYGSKKVICWGDSLTDGTGDNTAKPSTETNTDCSYPAVLGRMLGNDFSVVNGGVGGETSWMIASRQGGEAIYIEPTTIPATKTATRVYLKGQEQDYFWDKTQNKWVYSPNNLSYNIAVSDNSRVNPCYIDGIEGTLTRTKISAGTPDPTTGETVQSATFAYYFTRDEVGEAHTFITPKQLITNAYKNYRDAVNVIWCGQNDAPAHDGQYITQGNADDRIGNMLSVLKHKNYIVMDLPSGNDSSSATRTQKFNNRFGSHYINIRKYICEYGVAYVNSLGANITVSADDQAKINNGEIPSCLKHDGVHGNYWYYQIVAKAVYDKGKELGYW